MATSDEYLSLLQAGLPTGAAWPRDPDANLTKLLHALADEFARIHNRALDLFDEADPRTTLDLLPDWERVLGLPDECTAAADTIQERRDAVLQRLTSLGGQSIAYFIGVATALGYDGMTIEEFRPFRCGISHCGQDRLSGGPGVRHYWRARVPGARLTRFRCGSSRLGERLLDIDTADDLECLLTRLKPAHTSLIFSYEGV